MKFVTLERSIMLSELLSQHDYLTFCDEKPTLDLINSLIASRKLTLYYKRDYTTIKEKKWRCVKKHPEEISNLTYTLDGDKIIFDIDEIRECEKYIDASKNGISIRQEIDIQTELATVKKRIEELENELAEAKLTRKNKRDTSQATITRLRNDLQSWKDAIEIIVFVAMECQKDGPRKRSRTDIKNLCKRGNSTLSGVQLDALRQALPADYVDRENRADYSDMS